ncbi:hypothetical protein EDB19DRAFT_1828363 [Suillus lakei]|nr:hypothetical protein EDB19DRAFT_1828363 [Suillus lakei]
MTELTGGQPVASPAESPADTQCNSAINDWWGDFVPIDQWTPPRVRPQFQGIEFRNLGYDMSPETWTDTPGSFFGDYTPNKYDHCFAGVHKSIQELASICDGSQASSKPRTSEQSSMMDSVNELVGNCPPHEDLHDPTSISVDSSITEDEDEDNGPMYNVGWGWTTSANQLMEQDEDNGPVRWSKTKTTTPSTIVGGDLHPWVKSPHNTTPSLHLGMKMMTQSMIVGGGRNTAPAGEQPVQQDTLAVSSNKDLDPVYDCGWGWGGPAGCDEPIPGREPRPKVKLSLCPGMKVADPCTIAGGGGDPCLDDSPSNDLVVSLSEADEHMHAIINNAVHGLTNSWAPDEILWEHRHTLSGFAEARNQVTTVGVDACQLHHLIQLQRQLLKSIDHVIGSLENPEQ